MKNLTGSDRTLGLISIASHSHSPNFLSPACFKKRPLLFISFLTKKAPMKSNQHFVPSPRVASEIYGHCATDATLPGKTAPHSPELPTSSWSISRAPCVRASKRCDKHDHLSQPAGLHVRQRLSCFNPTIMNCSCAPAPVGIDVCVSQLKAEYASDGGNMACTTAKNCCITAYLSD